MPFYANYGYHPRIDLMTTSKNDNPTAEQYTRHLMELQVSMKVYLEEAQDHYKISADKL